MKVHHSAWISALVDDELHGWRRRWVEHHLRKCVACDAEYRHLRHVRTMLAGNLPQPAMSDSPEFFWSKVKREIERRGPAEVEAPLPRLTLADWLGQHAPALATATAIVALAVSAAVWMPRPGPVVAEHKVPAPTVMKVATAIPDTAATPLEPKGKDVTVIWTDGLPWTSDMTEMKTLFANLDT
jgi:anti-sigma factor RsiW